MANELYHYGVEGMHWGVRRYENPDGTLTPLGKKRYGHLEYAVENAKNDAGRVTAKNKLKEAVNKGAQNDTRSAATIARESGNITSRLADINRAKANAQLRKAKAGIDLSNMSDQELQKAINRMNMERTYRQLKTQDVNSGREHVGDILQGIGGATMAVASALSIALAIQQLRRGVVG